MICENCGAELQDPNQSFCPSCGIPKRVRSFKYSDLRNEFKVIKMKKNIYEDLDSDYIILFVDSKRYRVWLWYGSNTTTRMKFIAANLAPNIRDKYGMGFKIVIIDEGNEPLAFKITIGLEEEPDNLDHLYERAKEDKEFLEYLTKEKKWLLENRDFKALENSLKDIKSMIKSTIIKKLTIDRKKLSEIFSPELLEISKEDGLPKLKEFVLEYCRHRGVSAKIIGQVLKMKDIFNKKQYAEVMIEEGNRVYNLKQYDLAAQIYEKTAEWSNKKLNAKYFTNKAYKLALNSWILAGKVIDALRILEKFDLIQKYIILKELVKHSNDKRFTTNEILHKAIDKSLPEVQRNEFTYQILQRIVEK